MSQVDKIILEGKITQEVINQEDKTSLVVMMSQAFQINQAETSRVRRPMVKMANIPSFQILVT
jgi:hypothetical protein